MKGWCGGIAVRLTVLHQLFSLAVDEESYRAISLAPEWTVNNPTPRAAAPEDQATLPPPANPEPATLPPPPSDAATLAPNTPLMPAGDARAPAGYAIDRELGRGGMGVVYLARAVALDRPCALKMILAGVHSGDAEVERFRTEAQAIARLQHPGIVQVFEVGAHDGLPFMALEFCSGGSLEAKLAKNPLAPREAATLVKALAEAVQAAHQARVIHRDLKPANVLLTAQGAPKVTDFGLAKKLDEQGATRTGSVMGTPSYMPPEQAEGKKDIGPAADIYALGAILYECLASRPPFRAATVLDTILQVLTAEPVPVRQLNPQAPVDLETICLKCLQKEPRKRYATAQDLADDLDRYLGGRPILARRVGGLERAGKWVRRNPVVASLAAAVFLVLAAGVVVSSLFAAEARQQATLADRRADILEEQAVELEKEKKNAVASAQRAVQKEKETAQALEEAETTLIDSLLRPIGQKEGQVDPIEHDALRKLGGLTREETRVRFLAVALRDPETARRVGQRAEWVIQAAVGLNRGTRRKVEQLLVRRIQEPGVPEEVALACVLLGLPLNIQDRAWAERSAEALVAALRDARTLRVTHDLLARALGAVSGQLEEASAAKVAEAFLALTRDPRALQNDLSWVKRAFGAVGGRLDRAGVSKVADALVAALCDPRTSPDACRFVEPALRAASERLEAGAAARVADALVVALRDPKTLTRARGCQVSAFWAVGGRLDAGGVSKVADALVAALRDPRTSLDAHPWLTQALEAVGERLDAGDAAKVAEALLALTREPRTPPYPLPWLAGALRAVGGRLDAGSAAKVAEALVALMLDPKTPPNARDYLTRALGAVGGRLDAAGSAKVAGPLLALMRDPRTSPNANFLVARAVGEVGGRLDAGGAAKAADALVAALRDPRTLPHYHSSLIQALKAVGARLGTRGVVRVLQHPLAVGPAQRALLDLLAQPTRRTFSSPWQFIDWADSNGVDFLPEQASTTPR